jgi:hypothetical protein
MLPSDEHESARDRVELLPWMAAKASSLRSISLQSIRCRRDKKVLSEHTMHEFVLQDETKLRVEAQETCGGPPQKTRHTYPPMIVNGATMPLTWPSANVGFPRAP